MKHEKLKFLRKEKGMSQKEMAKILCTDVSSYSRKENGISKIHHDEWEKIAKALHVSIDEIKDSDSSVPIYFPDLIIEKLQNYIRLLKHENTSLKKELKEFRNK